jgi:hypothetical protein
MLPSKTIPDIKNQKRRISKHKTTTAGAPPRKKARTSPETEVEILEGEDRLDNLHPRHSSSITSDARSVMISPASSFQMSYRVPAKVRDDPMKM